MLTFHLGTDAVMTIITIFVTNILRHFTSGLSQAAP